MIEGFGPYRKGSIHLDHSSREGLEVWMGCRMSQSSKKNVWGRVKDDGERCWVNLYGLRLEPLGLGKLGVWEHLMA